MLRNRRILNINVKAMLICIVGIVFMESFLDVESKEIGEVVKIVFGYVNFNNSNVFLISIIKFLLPQIGIFIIWGNYFDENILKNETIIFIRTRKTRKIIWNYMLELIYGVCIMTILLELGVYIVYMLKGYQVGSMKELFVDLVLYALFEVFAVFLMNILSLIMKIMYGVIVVLFLQATWLESIYAIQDNTSLEKLYYIIPSSSVMLYKNQGVGDEYKIFWCVYLLCMIGLLFVCGCIVMKRKEFYE